MAKNQTAAFATLGCKVNQCETQALSEQFEAAGYKIVPFSAAADVYIVNTCSVTQMAESKSRRLIARAHRKNENAVIAVIGCYAQRDAEEVLRLPGVSIAVGNGEKHRLLELVSAFNAQQKTPVRAVGDMRLCKAYTEMALSRHDEKTRAYIKVQDGCNNYCTYCIIPYLRGPIRSRSVQAIREEAERLAAAGYREIVLNGINLSSYGKDASCTESLLDVIRAVHEVEGIERIRLGSLEPVLLTEEFIAGIRALKKMCAHFHISLQSGCDTVLRRMNRHYTTEDCRQAVARLRKHFGDCALSADIIVGFPGESDEEFQETVQFAREIGFAWAHVFAYSVRKGTVAARMEGQIAPQVKQERSAALIAVCEESGRAYREAFVGRTVQVLCQRVHNRRADGLTQEHIAISFPCEERVENRFVSVLVTGVTDAGLCGEMR